ncbi:MAG TPA: ATP-dependent helicase C-terminal domain-containing protein [Polyangia bacterium]|jgi:ATP-dependent helicase HrpB
MNTLPIDPLLPDVVKALQAGPAVVIEAPPGAGKTTRVPRAIFDGKLAKNGEILILQPRRLAARLGAYRVAEELGQTPGGTVGYTVRFEDVGSAETRLRFITEGILTRRLLVDPTLAGVAVVVLDEFHERHLATDLALPLLRRLQQTARPDLKLVVMSATLDAEPVRAYLDGCASFRSEGRRFDVAIEHVDGPDDRPLAAQVASAVRRLVREQPDGDILVFLPGAGEIRRAQESIAGQPGLSSLLVLPLHGEMSLSEQNRAVKPAGQRKVILSTNVAETSVTIDGVVAVIDSGLARVAAHSPWTGLPTVTLAKISQASAIQRAGRAGRTRAGMALRLYPRQDFDTRRRYELAEIARADLAEAALALHALGIRDLDDFPWFEAPPGAALSVAEQLLRRLGAVDDRGAVSALGRRMLRFPVHPRLERLVCAGEDRGVTDAACTLAALIAERDIRQRGRASFARAAAGPQGAGMPSAGDDRGVELLDLVEQFAEARRAEFAHERLRMLELDPRAVETVERARRQLRGLAAKTAPARDDTAPALHHPDAVEQAVAMAALTAFPDRVARRRRPGERTVLLAGGGAAELGFQTDADWIVAVDAEETGTAARAGGRVVVRAGLKINPDWLLDLPGEPVAESDDLQFDPNSERVLRVRRLTYQSLALDETITPAPPGPATAAVLAAAALSAGIETLDEDGALPRLRARVTFAREVSPAVDLPALDDTTLASALGAACSDATCFDDLRATGLATQLQRSFSADGQRALATLAPEAVTLPGGRKVTINYESGQPPWIASRLQDFFGMRIGPAVGGGRVPLTLHLLAPNQRAVQVTRDLESFWQKHYPPLRRELGRRYPKHAWPEDGATARPPPPLPPRKR